MCVFTLLLSVERLFHVYDGFVFPHANLWVRINNYFSITGIDTKESHGYALVIFLRTIHLNISGFDITRGYENACKMYFHLKQKKYLSYAAHNRYTNFCCIEQLNRGLNKVLCYILLMLWPPSYIILKTLEFYQRV